MKTLVIAEHDNGALKPETSKTINAAKKLGFDVDVLLASRVLQMYYLKITRCTNINLLKA